MKKVIILILFTILLTGCGTFNLDGFVMPDDLEFLAVVESLDTPEKICTYMKENFKWVSHFSAYSPYQMWLANTKTKAGDCNDFSAFAVWVAHYHGYEVYQIRVKLSLFRYHLLGVFVEGGFYTSSSNMFYYPWLCNSFGDVVKVHYNNSPSYIVYDYNNNVIEEGKNGR